MVKRNLDGSLITFEQDGKLCFEENEHKYSVDGIGELTSVSNVVGKFFKPFDAEFWSLRKCRGNRLNAERLREDWESKGAFACQAGTFLHKQIENYINGKEDAETICYVTYNGVHLHLSRWVDISKEWNFFQCFDREITYTPFRTEWGVFDADAHIAGTIDLICSRDDGTYEIYDWKRSSKIDPYEKSPWADGIHGLEHLTDTPYVHYCLQQNLYRHIVEKNYGLKISRMNLVVLHPDHDAYRLVNVPRMEKEVEIMMDFIRRQ